HTSGTHPAAVLRHGGEQRARCLSLHSIQTVATRDVGADALAGAAFGIEGDPDAVAFGAALVRAIGGTPLVIKPGAKALYHAAACMASNYMHTLIDASLRLYHMAGIERADGLAALMP